MPRNMERLKLRKVSLEPFFSMQHVKSGLLFGLTRSKLQSKNYVPEFSFVGADIKVLSPPECIKITVTLSFPFTMLSMSSSDVMRSITSTGEYWKLSFGYANSHGLYSPSKSKVENLDVTLKSASFSYDDASYGQEIILEFVSSQEHILSKIPVLYCQNLIDLLKRAEKVQTGVKLPAGKEYIGFMGLERNIRSASKLESATVTTNLTVENLTLRKILEAIILDLNLIFSEETKANLKSAILESTQQKLTTCTNLELAEMLDSTSRSQVIQSVDDLDFYFGSISEYDAVLLKDHLFDNEIPNASIAAIPLMISRDPEHKDQITLLQYIDNLFDSNGLSLYPTLTRSGFKYVMLLQTDSGTLLESSSGDEFGGLATWFPSYAVISQHSDVISFRFELSDSTQTAANAMFLESLGSVSSQLTIGQEMLLSLYDLWNRSAVLGELKIFGEPLMNMKDIISVSSPNTLIRGNYLVQEVEHKIDSSLLFVTEMKCVKLLETNNLDVEQPAGEFYDFDRSWFDQKCLIPQGEIQTEDSSQVYNPPTFKLGK